MLDYIELTTTNHFFDSEWLYVKVENNVYRYLVKPYKNLTRTKKAYILLYHDEFREYNFAFYDFQVRDLYQLLLKINSIGFHTIDLLIKEFSVDEFYQVVESFNYERLTNIKGIGPITSKTIIDSVHKLIFNLKLTAKDELIVKDLVKLGFSRRLILQKWSLVDAKLNSEEFIQQLIVLLGKNND